MKVTTERLDDCQVNVVIELDQAETDKKLRETARHLSRHYNVPGYRRGKAPFRAIVRVFGREAVQQQMLEEHGNDIFDEAMEQVEFEPYAVGDLKEVEWDPFRMTVLVPIEPEVDLGDYRAVRVPLEVKEITDEDIEAYIQEVRQEHGQWVPTEEAAGIGDQVIFDVHATAGVAVIMDNENYEMLLEEDAVHPLPGFHEEIVGMAPGDEKEFELEVPEEDLDEDAAGQTAAVRVKLHDVRKLDTLEDDELAMTVGDYDSLDDLRVAVRERMETEALETAEAEYLDKVLEAMIEVAPRIEFPPQALDREMELAMDQMGRQLAASGIQLDTFLQMIGKTPEAYKRDIRPAAEERLRKRLVLQEVGRQEGLEADPDAVQAEVERILATAGEDGADEVREMLESEEGRESIAQDLIQEEAQEIVVAIGKGEIETEAAAGEEAEAGAAPEAQAEGEVEAGAETEPEPEVEAGEESEADVDDGADA
jgi:trigger factor